jgi:hypothetical protein
MRYAAMTLIFGVALAPAQESTVRLVGTITDPTGAVIPAANVTARSLATGLERKAVANERETIRFLCCPSGNTR